jgi:hypothetical protein
MLSELADKAPGLQALYSRISPKDVRCTLITYTFGTEVASPKHATLGVVVSGVVEICDESRIESIYLAYQPIRVLESGGMFGDFQIVDRVLGVQMPAERESLKLYAGRRSVIILQKPENINLFSATHNEELFNDESEAELENIPAAHIFLRKPYQKHVVQIAYLHLDESMLQPQSLVFQEVLAQAWIKAATYRSGVNSYNLKSLFHFRDLVKQEWDKLSRIEESDGTQMPLATEESDGTAVITASNKKTEKKFNTSRAAPRDLQSIFADAIFEALSRPMRGDSLFAHRRTHLPNNCWVSLENDAKIAPCNVLTSCYPKPSEDPFYYPIDLYNFEINSHCSGTDREISAKAALGSQRIRGKKKNSPRDFYRSVAERSIKKYLTKLKAPQKADKSGEYEYNVCCVERDGLQGKMLLLEFRDRRNV